MIDTDKYEGISEDRVWKQYSTGLTSDYVYDYNVADEELVADAPILLEEVKRLRMYEVAWKILYDNAKEEERETRTRTWKEIMELVRCDVREMVDTGDAVFDEWAKRTIGGFE